MTRNECGPGVASTGAAVEMTRAHWEARLRQHTTVSCGINPRIVGIPRIVPPGRR